MGLAHDIEAEIKRSTLKEIGDKEFAYIRDLVYSASGIHLTDNNKIMVAGRINKLLLQKRMNSFAEYCDYVISDKSGAAVSELVTAISTNHTFFYREKEHFDYFKNTVLPKLKIKLTKENSRDLRIWSAGCSSGEEPFMLVMLMMEFFGNEYPLWDAGVLATDISDTVLKTAAEGIYDLNQLSNLPPYYRFKYFNQLDNGLWQVNDFVRKQVTFRRFNLINDTFPFKKMFHTIFCRNVMIYFDQKTKDKLVQNFYKFTEPEGYFFISLTETLGKSTQAYNYLMPSVYRKNK